jgi:hypothetical protein
MLPSGSPVVVHADAGDEGGAARRRAMKPPTPRLAAVEAACGDPAYHCML